MGLKLMNIRSMNIMFIFLVMFGFGLISPLKLKAQEHETPWAQDPRLIELEFDPQQSYLILTRPKSVTLIQMSPEESVVTAVAARGHGEFFCSGESKSQFCDGAPQVRSARHELDLDHQ
jgi:hypothetical protein